MKEGDQATIDRDPATLERVKAILERDMMKAEMKKNREGTGDHCKSRPAEVKT